MLIYYSRVKWSIQLPVDILEGTHFSLIFSFAQFSLSLPLIQLIRIASNDSSNLLQYSDIT